MNGITGLLRRIVGGRVTEFTAVDLPGEDREVFEVDHDAGQVVLRGTSPLAQAAALRWYLRHRCGTQVTWDQHADLPASLPTGPPVRIPAAFRDRYFFNPCTFGYTMPFWDWARWEREIDWLALHGVNRPLALTGQEAVWQRVLRRFDVADDEIRSFLGGPAYLPWTYMGCVSDWMGALPQEWIDAQLALGQAIVERQRDLGMTPVLGAFPGHVPAALARQHGGRPLRWFDFDTTVLAPGRYPYREMSRAFIEEQRDLLGTDHLYAADPLIEATPPVESDRDLAEIAAAIYEGMASADPDAVWVFQTWPFTYRSDYWTPDRIAAFLDAVPDDRMLVLDLWSDHEPARPLLRKARDKPWVWCMLHNFGGRPGMYGMLDHLATHPHASGADGIGATMEATGSDPAVYELWADVAWHGRVEDLDAWLERWTSCRYEVTDRLRGRSKTRDGLQSDEGAEEPSGNTVTEPLLVRAWQCLARTVYGQSDRPAPPLSIVTCRPSVAGSLDPDHPVAIAPKPSPDIPTALLEAWDTLMRLVDTEAAAGPAGRDLTDITGEVLARCCCRTHEQAVAAFTAGDPGRFDRAGDTLLGLIDDLDRILATRPEYLLGRWLRDARSRPGAPSLQEENARRLLTLWGGTDSALHDYAGRHWAGLVGGFYRERWRRWVACLSDCLHRGSTPDAVAFDSDLRRYEDEWCRTSDVLPTEPVGDTAAVAAEIHKRWRGTA